jgi:hypothetical protein
MIGRLRLLRSQVLAVTCLACALPVPAAAQSAAAPQAERLLTILPAGLHGLGAEILGAPDPVAQEALIRKLADQAAAADVPLPVGPFIVALEDAQRCPENSPAWTRPRTFPCVAQVASILGRTGDTFLRQALERWAGSHPDVRVADYALRVLERLNAAQLTTLVGKRIELARAAGDRDALGTLGRAQERVGSRLPQFWWQPPPRFEVAPPSKRIRVVAVGDSGTGNPSQAAVAATMRQYHREHPFDFGITLGDNYQDDGPLGPQDSRWQTYWTRHYPALGIRFYASLGNHDWGNPDGPGAEIAFAQGHAAFRFPSPYYTYTAGPVQFFVLNTPLLSEAQLLWLRDELAQSTSRWRVVYGHYHVYSALRGDNQPLITNLLPILQEHRVHLYLCGHEHLFQHLKPEGGVEFFVNGAAGGGGRAVRQQGYDRVLFMAEHEQGFTVLEADADVLTVRFVGEKGQTVYEQSLPRQR